jgi:hypothetical protein
MLFVVCLAAILSRRVPHQAVSVLQCPNPPLSNQADLTILSNMQRSGGHPWVYEANIVTYEGYGE